MWRPVPGFEGWYEVSDLGRVRSLDREVVEVGTGRVQRHRGRVLRPSPVKDGYLAVSLMRNRRKRTIMVHLLVAEVFLGPCPVVGFEVCHGPAGKAVNEVGNIRWDSHSANMLDAVREGCHRWSSRASA